MAALSLATSSARGDVVLPPPRSATLRLSSVAVLSGDAPAADREAVERQVRRGLASRSGRLRRCLADVDLRDPPLRRRSRRVVGHLTFSRSARPSVRIGHAEGVPRAAIACVREVVEAIAVRSPPRGTVEVRVVYAVGR